MITKHLRCAWLALLGPLATTVTACSADPYAADSPAQASAVSAGQSTEAAISLPADEGPHPNQPSEWWYYTGHLADETGARYGFELVFFQFPNFNYAQFAVTDANGHTFHHQTSTPSAASPPMTHNRFDLHTVEGWSAAGTGGNDRIAAKMEDGTALDLRLHSLKSPAFDYHQGTTPLPTGGNTFAYSRTRLAAEGSLQVEGRTLRVDGSVWFDHQWGAYSPALGWDWMGLQLDNGEEIMAVQLRDVQTQTVLGSTGNFISKSCVTSELPPNDPAFEVMNHWVSPHTQKSYPSGWHVDIPSRGLKLTLVPVLEDQEVFKSPVVYWEGEVTISGTENGRPVQGRGFVELVGY